MSQSLPSGQSLANDANLSGSLFHNVNLSHASIRNACLHDFTIADANYYGMQIEGIPVSELLQVYREHKA